MAMPHTQPGLRTLLSAVIGHPVGRNTPGWMDRKFGYVPKAGRGGNTKAQRKKRK